MMQRIIDWLRPRLERLPTRLRGVLLLAIGPIGGTLLGDYSDYRIVGVSLIAIPLGLALVIFGDGVKEFFEGKDFGEWGKLDETNLSWRNVLVMVSGAIAIGIVQLIMKSR